MDSNTHSIKEPSGLPARPSDGLAALAAAVDQLAAQGLDGLSDPVRAERVLVLRRLLDRLEGHWLRELAAVDARGAAGADHDQPAGSTASWLRHRLRMGASAAHGAVKTARVLFRGPLSQTATALTDGELSPAHASVLAVGTQELPDQVTVEAEPVLLDAARRLDPPLLRRVIGHLQLVADPHGAQAKAERRHQRRGLWLAPTLEGMVALDGLLEPEAGHTLMSALEPLARPASATDDRSGGQRRADALTELARRSLEAGRLPRVGGVRPQLTVMVDLDSLQGGPRSLGGDTELGPLPRGVGGWPVTAPSPESWSPATPATTPTRTPPATTATTTPAATMATTTSGATTATTSSVTITATTIPTAPATMTPAATSPATTTPLATGATITLAATGAWRPNCGPPRPCCPRSWVGPPASPWTSAAPPGSSNQPNGPPWRCGTVAVSSLAVLAPWPGVRPTISCTGWMAAPRIWTTWSWCAGPIIGRSMRAAGGWSEALTGGRPPPHRIDPTEDSRPPPDRRGRTPTSSWPGAPGRGAPTRRRAVQQQPGELPIWITPWPSTPPGGRGPGGPARGAGSHRWAKRGKGPSAAPAGQQ